MHVSNKLKYWKWFCSTCVFCLTASEYLLGDLVCGVTTTPSKSLAKNIKKLSTVKKQERKLPSLMRTLATFHTSGFPSRRGQYFYILNLDFLWLITFPLFPWFTLSAQSAMASNWSSIVNILDDSKPLLDFLVLWRWKAKTSFKEI